MNWLISDLDHCLVYPKKRSSSLISGPTIDVFTRATDKSRGMEMPVKLAKLVENISQHRVAVTARSYNDVAKLQFPFEWDYIISSHGADIFYHDKLLCNFVSESSQKAVYSTFGIIGTEKDFLTANCQDNFINSLECIYSGQYDDIPSFIEIKLHNADDFDKFAKTYSIYELISDDLEIYRNKKVITLIPKGINKAAALAYLKESIIKQYDPDSFLIGAGDSNSDVPFLKLCDWVMAPSNSQIIMQNK